MFTIVFTGVRLVTLQYRHYYRVQAQVLERKTKSRYHTDYRTLDSTTASSVSDYRLRYTDRDGYEKETTLRQTETVSYGNAAGWQEGETVEVCVAPDGSRAVSVQKATPTGWKFLFLPGTLYVVAALCWFGPALFGWKDNGAQTGFGLFFMAVGAVIVWQGISLGISSAQERRALRTEEYTPVEAIVSDFMVSHIDEHHHAASCAVFTYQENGQTKKLVSRYGSYKSRYELGQKVTLQRNARTGEVTEADTEQAKKGNASLTGAFIVVGCIAILLGWFWGGFM